MTKPWSLATGIGGAAALCALLAAFASRWPAFFLAYTSAGCAAVALAYAANRPDVFGKRDGRVPISRAALLFPFLATYGLACLGMRWSRRWPMCARVAAGVYVGGRPRPEQLPRDVEQVVDLTAEFSAPRDLRRRRGYRSLPVMDGHTPPDLDAFLDLLRQVCAAPGAVLFHCESGRGRAPTAAAAALLVTGAASDVATAVEWVKKGRPQSHPTRSDLEFLERVARRLRPKALPMP